MSSYREIISGFDLEQLENFHSVISGAIAEKKAEETKIVWRVCDRWTCKGNFREEDYLKAVDFMAEKAKKAHSDLECELIRSSRDLCFEIQIKRIPISEYEEWFK
ncbi:TPA: hypothetical protein U5D73_000050 [Yersinia enterocolitica]|uniref:hypothetical protein n=1 Tax=Yersinia enterocolitica TaxID=630 RepID=UPI002AC412AA|nr:hypothetical protein [Yersinia enterocolitica]EKN6047545.1 hypothetical protein [Yersinia enterocolitica]HEN3447669.1 hypothetical protein [Yersinia enterocolitica]